MVHQIAVFLEIREAIFNKDRFVTLLDILVWTSQMKEGKSVNIKFLYLILVLAQSVVLLNSQHHS